MLEKFRQNIIHKTPVQWVLSLAASVLIAALICALGCWTMILRGPYTAYRKTFVAEMCEKTHFDFAIRLILGAEQMDQILSEVQEGSQQ